LYEGEIWASHGWATHDILEHTREGQDETRSNSDQKDSGDLYPRNHLVSHTIRFACDSHSNINLNTHVEGKRHSSVGKQDKRADSLEVVKRLDTLDQQHEDKVESSADGRIVVEGDQGVHLERKKRDCKSAIVRLLYSGKTHLHAVQQDLDHDQSRGLEAQGETLTDESDHLKVDFTVGGC